MARATLSHAAEVGALATHRRRASARHATTSSRPFFVAQKREVRPSTPTHTLVGMTGLVALGITKLLIDYGLILLFALIALESAGVPLPGETALIAAAVLAEQGHYSLVEVIAVAAAAAIVGDNGGYWIGRKGGRALLRKTPVIRDVFERALPPAERFFALHGAKTVFFGRFIAFLRITAAWLAGISHMPWWRFLFWNALGGVIWAVLVGFVAYHFGRAAAEAINHYGLIGGIVVVALLVILFIAFRIWKKRMLKNAET
jgi:membrane protein DedA with SNARE-associated domain